MGEVRELHGDPRRMGEFCDGEGELHGEPGKMGELFDGKGELHGEPGEMGELFDGEGKLHGELDEMGELLGHVGELGDVELMCELDQPSKWAAELMCELRRPSGRVQTSHSPTSWAFIEPTIPINGGKELQLSFHPGNKVYVLLLLFKVFHYKKRHLGLVLVGGGFWFAQIPRAWGPPRCNTFYLGREILPFSVLVITNRFSEDIVRIKVGRYICRC
ncbi:hypothetical protein ACS0TY_028539 [Phlomoides rotata]